MKIRLVICLLAATAAGLRGGAPDCVPAAVCREAPRAWLGLKLEKPAAEVAAQAPGLPEGMGFLITAVEEGGPAAACGIRALDLLWKYRDQMLVNESQLAALLRMSRPGEEIELGIFRGGQARVISLTLGEAPVRPRGDVADDSCEKPVRGVNATGKSVRFSADREDAVVSRDGDDYHVEIRGQDGGTIFDGRLGPHGGIEQVPEPWQRRVQILCRTLDRALDGGLAAGRQPRPRVVPPAAAVP